MRCVGLMPPGHQQIEDAFGSSGSDRTRQAGRTSWWWMDGPVTLRGRAAGIDRQSAAVSAPPAASHTDDAGRRRRELWRA